MREFLDKYAERAMTMMSEFTEAGLPSDLINQVYEQTYGLTAQQVDRFFKVSIFTAVSPPVRIHGNANSDVSSLQIGEYPASTGTGGIAQHETAKK